MAKNTEKQKNTRLAIVNPDICKPDQCNLECKRSCPVNKIGKACITVTKKDKISVISEILCIGCGACVKKCPFNAITIINLPTNLEKDTSHRYSSNGFKLHRLPVPKLGSVLGLVGTNGIGKSTALKILAGEVKPNLGDLKNVPDWIRILNNYKGSELQSFFTKLLGDEIKAETKIQYIDKIPLLLKQKYKKERLTVNEVLSMEDGRGMKDVYIGKFRLENVLDRDLDELSGGELQRFSCLLSCIKKADIYFFDEPSSYLDVKQRLFVAEAIRSLSSDKNYILVVEHDLAILDMMCDYGCVLYGKAGAYGVITTPYTIKQSINIFLDGYIPNENMRFRTEGLKFNISERPEKSVSRDQFCYPEMAKKYRNKKNEVVFELKINEGHFSKSEIIVFLGENGMGKTTFVSLIAGLQNTEDGTKFPEFTVSIKAQKIAPKFDGSVRDLFMSKIRSAFLDPYFTNEVVKPLSIDYILNSPVKNLSGGELQRVAIILCLGKDADVYLIDEPSAYLDSDQRIAICKVIKRFMYARNKTAFIVEHDLIVGTYLADKIVVFDGEPGKKSEASSPLSLEEGMNVFLKKLDVTFRRDPSNYRPRVNKYNSARDREQKEKNKYFFA